MKLPDWDDKFKRWDRYSAFHMGAFKQLCATDSHRYPPFIIFDSGEVISPHFKFDPYARGHYPLLDVSVFLTSDAGCPTLYLPDGTPVKKAWCDNEGHQFVIVDHATKRVVTHGNAPDAKMPDRFKGFRAYWKKPGAPPVGGPITICRPDQIALTKEERQRKEDMSATAIAAMKLTDHPALQPRRWGTDPMLSVDRLLAVQSWDELNEDELRSLYHRGVARRQVKYDYLLTEKP